MVKLVNRKILALITAIVMILPNHALALSTELQATVLNTAVNSARVAKVESLKAKISYLANTLDNHESLTLTQHPELKISSYMFLTKLWEQKPLKELLLKRGVDVERLVVKVEEAGLDIELLDLPLYKFGSNAVPLNQNCSTVSNPMSASSLGRLYQLLQITEELLVDSDSYAADAMVFFIQLSTLIKLHDPMMTHAMTTEKCVSDLEGSLTCADGFYETKSIDESLLTSRLDDIAEMASQDIAMIEALGSSKVGSLLGRCYVPMRFYTKTNAMMNPFTDTQIISLSEILYKNNQVRLHSTLSKLNVNEVYKENFNVLDVIYNFPRYVRENNLKGSRDELFRLRNDYLRQSMFKRLEAATLNTAKLINETSLL